MDPLLTKDDIAAIVQTEIKQPFQIIEYSLTPFRNELIGFLASHLKLQVLLHLHDDSITKDLKYFVKVPPYSNPQMFDYSVTSGAFQKEIEFYKLLVKDISTMTGIRGKRNNCWCPLPLLVKNNLLVLEDLTSKNYRVPESTEQFDLNHIKESLKVAAIMHAQCFSLEQTLKGRVLYDHYPTIFAQVNFSLDEKNPFRQWMVKVKPQLSVFADLLQGYSEIERATLRHEFPLIIEELYEAAKPSTKYRNTFNHGDFWGSNLLFKYDANNHPKEAIIVDYQLSRYAPPVYDVAELLCLTASKALRDAEEENLLEFYYQHLKSELSCFNCDIDGILSWKEFQKSWTDYKKYGLLRAGLILNIVITPKSIKDRAHASSEIYSKFMTEQRQDYIKESFEISEIYKARNSEIWKEIADLYILKKQ